MKKALLILSLATLCCTSEAQVLIAVLFGDKLNTGKLEFGITVNPALTNVTHLHSKLKPGLNLGVYFNLRPDKKIFLHLEGIAKGSFGAKGTAPYPTGNDSLDDLFAGGSVQRNIKAFCLPVLVRYAFSQHFFAEAGIQADMILKVKDVFQTKVADNDLEYTVKVTDQFTLLDFGVTAGAFYKLRTDRKSMGIGLRYVYGLTDIYKPVPGNQVNIAWQLTLTIPIGAGKTPATM